MFPVIGDVVVVVVVAGAEAEAKAVAFPRQRSGAKHSRPAHSASHYPLLLWQLPCPSWSTTHFRRPHCGHKSFGPLELRLLLLQCTQRNLLVLSKYNKYNGNMKIYIYIYTEYLQKLLHQLLKHG